ncbi:MAG: ABC transporter permease [Nocardioidaceae bacterium]
MRNPLSILAKPFVTTTGLARWMLVAGVLMTGFFVVLAIFAPWIAPYDFAQHSSGGVEFQQSAPPSSEHLFGTSHLKFDVLSRTIWGARTAVEVVILALIGSLVVGVLLGLISGYYGRWLDRILTMIMDAIFAFPSLLLAIVFAFLFTNLIGGSVIAAAGSLTVIYIPQYFRIVRNTTISAKEAAYVEAARAIGAPDGVIMRRYLFGNVIQSVPVIGTLNAADAIGTLAGLGFLGLGIQPTEASEWGYSLQKALSDVGAGIWWTAVYPGLAIVLLITGLTLVGEGLNETVNPILRKRKLLPVIMPPRKPQGQVMRSAEQVRTTPGSDGVTERDHQQERRDRR